MANAQKRCQQKQRNRQGAAEAEKRKPEKSKEQGAAKAEIEVEAQGAENDKPKKRNKRGAAETETEATGAVEEEKTKKRLRCKTAWKADKGAKQNKAWKATTLPTSMPVRPIHLHGPERILPRGWSICGSWRQLRILRLVA